MAKLHVDTVYTASEIRSADLQTAYLLNQLKREDADDGTLGALARDRIDSLRIILHECRRHALNAASESAASEPASERDLRHAVATLEQYFTSSHVIYSDAFVPALKILTEAAKRQFEPTEQQQRETKAFVKVCDDIATMLNVDVRRPLWAEQIKDHIRQLQIGQDSRHQEICALLNLVPHVAQHDDLKKSIAILQNRSVSYAAAHRECQELQENLADEKRRSLALQNKLSNIALLLEVNMQASNPDLGFACEEALEKMRERIRVLTGENERLNHSHRVRDRLDDQHAVDMEKRLAKASEAEQRLVAIKGALGVPLEGDFNLVEQIGILQNRLKSWQGICSIICQEMGVDVDEVNPQVKALQWIRHMREAHAEIALMVGVKVSADVWSEHTAVMKALNELKTQERMLRSACDSYVKQYKELIELAQIKLDTTSHGDSHTALKDWIIAVHVLGPPAVKEPPALETIRILTPAEAAARSFETAPSTVVPPIKGMFKHQGVVAVHEHVSNPTGVDECVLCGQPKDASIHRQIDA